MDSIIEYYILETCVSHLHIEKILSIIKENSNKKAFISIYPKGYISL